MIENKIKKKVYPADYDPLRSDKKRLPPPTEEEYRIARQNIAVVMYDRFGWRDWMEGVIKR